MSSCLNATTVGICYSLPRIVASSGSVVLLGYIGLLYINTYKWRPEHFGRVYSFYYFSTSISQFVIALLLQFVFVSPDEAIGLKNCKIAQIVNVSAHSITLFFIILLPILKSKCGFSGYGLDTKTEKDIQEWSLQSSILNTRCFIHLIYFFAIVHGYGWGAFEIYDRLLPTYITKDATYLSSTNDFVRGLCNLSIPLIIMFLNKIVGKRYPDYSIYLGVGIVLTILVPPLCTLFYIFTQRFVTGSAIDASDVVPATANLDYSVLIWFPILESAYGILYLSCPIIIQYISTHLRNDDENFRLCASTLFMTFFFLGSVFYKVFSHFITLPKKTVSYLCIACHSVGYLLLFPYRYSWNKTGILHYILLSLFNIFIMIGYINTNIMMTNQLADDNHKKYRWLLLGFIYVIKNFNISVFMKTIYTSYDREEIQLPGGNPEERELPIDNYNKTRRWKFKLSFANLAMLIYLMCQLGNLIGTIAYKEHTFD